MRRTWALLTSTLLVGLLAGCSSSIVEQGDDDDGSAGSAGSSGNSSNGKAGAGNAGSGAGSPGSGGLLDGTGGGSGSGGSGASAGVQGISGGPSTLDCPTAALPRTPLRRLTRTEYANSARDLLNVDVTPTTDMPPDEVTLGYDNNAGVLTVSSLHAEKYVLVSEELAKAAVTANLAALTNNCNAPAGEEACAQEFAERFGRRAFRRAVTAEDQQSLMAAYTLGRTNGDYAHGIEVMIRLALQSPNFIYRLETTTPATPGAALVPLSQFELATRLSYLLWGSGPDDALLDAAAGGQLGTRELVAQKARQMLADPKARGAIANFVSQWTSTNRLKITTKSTAFPLFTAKAKEAMQAEMPAFLDYVLWTGDHTLKTLLTAPIAFVNDDLAPIYGVASPGGAALQRVDLPAAQGRSGILTQAGFLSVQGHPDQTSPVLRGKFVRSMLLCTPPPPPPDDVDISLPEVDPNATARDRFGAHLTAGNTCNGCHTLMDPIGFSFEHFDAMGVYREKEGTHDIDVNGEILEAEDPALAGAFNGVQEMGQKLAGSDQVRDCVAMQMFRFAAGRREGQDDSCSLGTIQETFAAANGDMIELLVALTQSDSFWYRTPVTP